MEDEGGEGVGGGGREGMRGKRERRELGEERGRGRSWGRREGGEGGLSLKGSANQAASRRVSSHYAEATK